MRSPFSPARSDVNGAGEQRTRGWAGGASRDDSLWPRRDNLSGRSASSMHVPAASLTADGGVRVASPADLPEDREQAVSALVRYALGPPGPRGHALGRRPPDRRGGRPGRVRGHLREVGPAARHQRRAGLPAELRRQRQSVAAPPPRCGATRYADALGRSRAVCGGGGGVPRRGRRRTPCLARLPTRQRQVLVLRYYLDLHEAEIAEVLSISPRIREGLRLPGAGRHRGRHRRGGCPMSNRSDLTELVARTLHEDAAAVTVTPAAQAEQRFWDDHGCDPAARVRGSLYRWRRPPRSTIRRGRWPGWCSSVQKVPRRQCRQRPSTRSHRGPCPPLSPTPQHT